MARNVALLVLDTVRKEYFNEYAPRLQARSDASYEECRAAAAWTVPSHASMFTGELAHEHGVHTHNRNFGSLDAEDTFLADLNDYRTIGVSANVYAGPTFGFDDLFDEFTAVTGYNWFLDGMNVEQFLKTSDREGLDRYRAFLSAAFGHPHTLKSLLNGFNFKLETLTEGASVPKLSDDGADHVVEASKRHVAGGDEPFFLFTNLMDAHPPFQHTRGYDRDLHDAPSDWTSLDFDYWAVRENHSVAANQANLDNFRSLYGAAVDYLDRQLAPFVDWLLDATNRETTVVITADHGEELGYECEDYRIGHLGSLGEGLLHVPCLVVNPPGDLNTDGYFSHLNLGTLVQGLARGETPSVVGERAVAEMVGGMRQDFDAPLSEERFEYWNRMLRAAYDGDRKVVWDSLGEVRGRAYDVSGPASTETALDEEVAAPEWCGEYFESDIAVYKQRVRTGEARALDDVTENQLEGLGYL
jgi:arylsulfatase A-like enzyme